VWPPGSADTVCPRPPLTLTFDRLTLKLVCESHLRWGTFRSNLGTLGLWVLELFATRDGRTDGQTDGRTDKSKAYCPFPTGGSIIKCGRRQLAVLLTGGQLDTERRADVNVPAVGGAPCVNQLSQTQQRQVRRTTSRRERSGQEWHDGHRLQRSVMSTSQATFLIRSRSLFIQMTHNIQGGPEMVQLTACSRQNVQSVSC